MSDKDLFDENNYNDEDRKVEVDLKNPLKLNNCDEKSTSKKLKGGISRNIIPNLEIMEDSNSKIMVDLNSIMDDILNNENKYINATEETINILSELILSHSVIDDSISNIRNTNKKL